jgi:hypothetical protein
MYQVSQASFIKIPPLLLNVSLGKHSANQIAAASLNMHRICQTSNLNEGLMYQVSQASFIKIPHSFLRYRAESETYRQTDRKTDKVITIGHPHRDAGP